LLLKIEEVATMRIKADGVHYHIVTRCNNGERLLKEDDDCVRVLEHLKYNTDKHGCIIFNYVIMPSHMHLMLMTDGGNHIDAVMHDFCLAVAKDYNKRHGRGGHFWRHRYRSRIIDDDRYALACLRYIDMNPVAAGLTRNAEEWGWSGHGYYAFGDPSELITEHPSYSLLGENAKERRRNYRSLVEESRRTHAEERVVFETNCREGSRRYKSAYRRAMRSIQAMIPHK
jgi:putative transposase